MTIWNNLRSAKTGMAQIAGAIDVPQWKRVSSHTQRVEAAARSLLNSVNSSDGSCHRDRATQKRRWWNILSIGIGLKLFAYHVISPLPLMSRWI